MMSLVLVTSSEFCFSAALQHVDALGDRRAACATCGASLRTIPFERAFVRVCREAGGRAALNGSSMCISLT